MDGGIRCMVSTWRRVPDHSLPGRGKITGAGAQSPPATSEAVHTPQPEAGGITLEWRAPEATAIAEGVRESFPEAEVVEIPVADGGDGTVEALVASHRGTLHHVDVEGPLGDTVTAAYGLIAGGRVGVVELALSSGLALVPRG